MMHRLKFISRTAVLNQMFKLHGASKKNLCRKKKSFKLDSSLELKQDSEERHIKFKQKTKRQISHACLLCDYLMGIDKFIAI